MSSSFDIVMTVEELVQIDAMEQFRERLVPRLDTVARAWREAICQVCTISVEETELQQDILHLVQQVLDALLAEPFDPQLGYNIGNQLAAHHCLKAEILARSHDILTSQLVDNLGPSAQTALMDRLYQLLLQFDVGFIDRMRQMILEEQAQIQASIFTVEQKTHADLRESRERFRLLTEATFEGIVIHDQTRILEVNQTLATMFGYEPAELVGESILKLAPRDLHDFVVQQVRNQIDTPYESIGLKRDGSTVPVEIVSRPFPYHGRIVRVAAIRSIRTRKQAQAELALARRKLALLRESERLHVAHELHDGPIQELLIISHRLAALRLRSKAHSDELVALREAVVEQVNALRRLYIQLRPYMLDELGPLDALRALILEQEEENNFQVSFQTRGDVDALPEALAVTIFRVVQEALTNAARHSGAEQITLELDCSESRVALTINDNGKGFHLPRRLSHLVKEGHFGIVGMVERVELLGGRYLIKSEPGAGTTIQAWLPAIVGET